jgi:hypothetical protein
LHGGNGFDELQTKNVLSPTNRFEIARVLQRPLLAQDLPLYVFAAPYALAFIAI